MKFWQTVPWVEIDQLLDVAKIAEDVGFEGVMGADHAVLAPLRGPLYTIRQTTRLLTWIVSY